MQIETYGQQMDVTPALRSYVETRFERLGRHGGGLRHFVWDMGKGYEPETRMKMAKFTLIGSVSLTVLVWIVALALR